MNKQPIDVFWELYGDLPQQGPGSEEATLRALQLDPELVKAVNILDVGCGSGRQTLTLARCTDSQITAVDTHQPFLDELTRLAENAGLADRVVTVNQSMTELDFAPGYFDLIWSEGAIYIMGFRTGLKSWQHLLKPGGVVAVTELTWLTENHNAELSQFWKSEYPAMSSIAENLASIEELGYELLGHFSLPTSAWSNYYLPVGARIHKLTEKYAHDREAMKVLDASQLEIDMFEKYSDDYGYVFYMMRLP